MNLPKTGSLFIVVWLLLAATAIGLVLRLPNLHEAAELSDTRLQQYPGTDWVMWADGPRGPYARQVLPPIRQNSWIRQDYIQPGDELESIDYQPIPSAHLAHTLSRAAAPGTVRLYQLLRPGAGQQPARRLALFVQTTYKPVFLFAEDAAAWQLYIVYLALLGGSSLALLSLLIPFFRTRIQGIRSLLLLLLLALLWVLWQGARHVVLTLDDHFRYLGFEQIGFLGAALLWLCLTVLVFHTAHQRSIRYSLPSILLGLGLWMALLAQVMLYRVFTPYQLWAYQALHLFFVVHVVVGLGFQRRQARQRRTQQALLLLMLVMGAALCVLWADSWQPHLLGRSARIWLYAGLQFSLILPLGLGARNLLAYGNVSLVLGRSLALALGLSGILLVYLLLDVLLESLLGNALNRGLLEIGIISALVLGIRYLYLRYQDWFNRVLPLGPARREQQLQAFLQRIPRYTSSKKLVDDVAVEAAYFAQAQFCELHTDDHSSSPLSAEDNEVLAQINPLLAQQTLWSSAKQLNNLSLAPHLEQWLTSRNVALVFPLHQQQERLGLMLLGPRKTGVYHLGETEYLARLATQARLSLEILYLLEREKELVQKNLEANLAALRSQINPHFLFNTLNTISDLVHSSPNLAEQAIEKLAFIFRYTLRVSGANFVPLAEELSLVRSYLDIEQIRFGSRLSTRIEVEEAAQQVEIPAFVLQTLVENCIKHGIAKQVEQGRIEITARYSAGQLVCTVYDNGPGIQAERIEKGTGLRNIIARMRNLYPQGQQLTFDNTGAGTLVTLKIPVTHA
ncbi:MAG: histidine kinase [Bacteroidetes bacterium]|nr:histidine kinase [Bacteroidota bacterium]